MESDKVKRYKEDLSILGNRITKLAKALDITFDPDNYVPDNTGPNNARPDNTGPNDTGSNKKKEPLIVTPEDDKSSQNSNTGTNQPPGPSSGILNRDNPDLIKYVRMKRVGVPPQAIKQKMASEGVNPELFDKPDGLYIGHLLKPQEEKKKVVIVKDPIVFQQVSAELKATEIDRDKVNPNSLWGKSEKPLTEDEKTLLVGSFSKELKPDVEKDTSSQSSTAPPPPKPGIITGKPLMDFEMQYRRFGITLEKTQDKLYNLDNGSKYGDKECDTDALVTIFDFLPKAAYIKEFEKLPDATTLQNDVERYFYGLLKIPRRVEMAKLLLFRLRYEKLWVDFESSVSAINEAMNVLRNSQEFGKLISKIAQMVSVIATKNKGQNDNSIKKFDIMKINDLRKTDMTIAKNGNLLTSIVKILTAENPNTIAQVLDLKKTIHSARLTAFANVRNGYNSINDGVALLDDEYKAAFENADTQTDYSNALHDFKPFTDKLKVQSDELWKGLETKITEFREFLDVGSSFEPVKFFEELDLFLIELEKVDTQLNPKILVTSGPTGPGKKWEKRTTYGPGGKPI